MYELQYILMLAIIGLVNMRHWFNPRRLTEGTVVILVNVAGFMTASTVIEYTSTSIQYANSSKNLNGYLKL